MSIGNAVDYSKPEQALKLVFDFVEDSEQALSPLFEHQWRRNELLYWSRMDKTMWRNAMGATQWQNGSPFESSLFMPTVLQQVELLVPRLSSALLANNPMVRATPLLRPEETLAVEALAWEQAEAKERWLHHQFVRDVRIRRRLAPWLRGAALHGTKMLFVDWISRDGPDWKQVPKTNAQGQETGVWEYKKGKSVRLEDRIRVTGHALWDVYPDPRGQTFRGEDGVVCRAVARKIIMDCDDLIGWIKGSPTKDWWFKKTKQGKQKKGKTPSDATWMQELKDLQDQVKPKDNKTACILAEVGRLGTRGGHGHSSGQTTAKQDKKLICLYDYWEPAGGRHMLVAGTKSKGLLLLTEPNPFTSLGLPFIAIRPVPLDNQLYGMGIVDMIEHLVHEVNALTNLHMTGAIREANPMVFLDTASGLSAAELMAQPYAIHAVNSMVDIDSIIKIVPFTATSAAAHQEREYAMGQLEATSGGSDFAMTGDPGKNTTARGINSFIQQHAPRFVLEAFQCGEAICELAEAMDIMNSQFITGMRTFSFADPKAHRNSLMSISPTELARPVEIDFDARPEAANPDLRANQVLQWVETWKADPNFDTSEAIVESGQHLRIPMPQRFLKERDQRPELENALFRESVKAGAPYFGNVLPGDDHMEHMEHHELVFKDGTVERGGEPANRVFVEHLMRHMQAMAPGAMPEGEQQPQGQQPQGQETQVG